jgi:uncharacterized protein YggU (UPF0235/DUF167 family)
VSEAATRLRLRVVPGGRRDRVVGRYDDGWKVRVAARPERGAANRALVRFLAETLSLPEHSVAIVSGRGARDKIVEVRGIAPPVTEGRLSAAERKESRR